MSAENFYLMSFSMTAPSSGNGELGVIFSERIVNQGFFASYNVNGSVLGNALNDRVVLACLARSSGIALGGIKVVTSLAGTLIPKNAFAEEIQLTLYIAPNTPGQVIAKLPAHFDIPVNFSWSIPAAGEGFTAEEIQRKVKEAGGRSAAA